MNINATILGQTISFIFFVLICMKYILPNITNLIENRQKEIQLSLKFSEDLKKETLNMREKAENEIHIAKKKAKEIINKAKNNRDLIIDAAIINAKQKRKKIILDGIKKLSLKKKIVLNDLKNESIVLSISIAKKILKKYVYNNDIDNVFKKINFDI
ncbi:F0F1 ATP synthase subunit B [Buchnera aphidicola (Ceratoglyphina bambusae)]|uniref:F0F1 ATP synthase subunit B n=1 Tax=Buchnera aphidicola TaxID=9 RepID=UPI0031B80EDC